MTIYYFTIAYKISEGMLATLLPCLPKQQRDIVEKMHTHARRVEQTVAYALLVHGLSQPLSSELVPQRCGLEVLDTLRDIPSIQLPLWEFGPVGKPSLVGRADRHFNISHCREAVAVVVSDREVGIDVEGRRRFSDNLLQRALNEREQETVLASDDPELEFARIWTRKEAFFKWTGTGILIEHLKSVEDDSRSAGCKLTTLRIEDFNLTVAEKATPR